MAIDRHAARADRIRLAWTEGGRLGPVLRDIADDLHPTSFVGPLWIGSVAAAVGSTLVGFLLVDAMLLGLCACLVRRLARRVADGDPEFRRRAGRCGVLLFLTGIATLRCSMQLHVDVLLLAIALAALDAAAAWSESGRTRAVATMALAHVAGVFTKLSYLPWLATSPVAWLVTPMRRRTWRAALLPVVVPLVALATHVAYFGGPSMLRRDFDHLTDSWNLSPRKLIHFAGECVLACQWLPWVLRTPKHSSARASPARRLLVVMLVVYAVALAAWRLPAIGRLMLPIATLLAILAAGRVAAATGRQQRVVVATIVIGIVVATIGVHFDL